MNRRIAGASLFAAFATAGCDSGAPPENVTRISIANPHSEQLKALTPDMQRLGLLRAIRDGGRRCRRVEASAYQQEYRGLAMWVALCDDGRQWSVFIAPNADLQVRDCAENAQVDLPQCRPLQAPAAAPEPVAPPPQR